jgi:hypothetical protein
MTSYSDKELRAEAIRAIRDRAKAEKMRARYTGFSVHLDPHGTNGDVDVTLVAYGTRTDLLPYRQAFSVNVAI